MYESYGYDAAGQQRSHTIVDGTTPVTSTLDVERRTTAIAEGLGGSGPYTSTYGYNANDLPISTTMPNGVHTSMGYDPNSQLISVTATGPAQTPATTTLSSAYAYGYNATGWLTSTTTLSGTDTITHDAQGRLTADCGPQVVAKGGCARWTYDANGNLLTATDDSGVTDVYSYTAGQPNEQTAGGSSTSPATATIALAYDAHGDTTSISNPVALTDPTSAGYKKYALNESFGYDAAARPITVTRLVGNKDGTTTPLTATLRYNADGLRADYLLTPAPGEGNPVDTRFAYRDGVLASATVTDSTGTLLYKNTFIYGPAGEPYELIRTDPKGTSRYWYTLDGLGSVVALTSITGTVVDRYAYDSWGEETSSDALNETVPQQLRYRGYYYDEALTYYWVTTRYYDPEAMRWLQPDPSEQDGVRTYVYVDNDPADYSDPTGLHKYIIWAAAFIAPRSIRFPCGGRYGLHKDDASFHGDARGFWNGMGAPPTMGDYPIGQSRQSSRIWNYIEIDTNPQLSNPVVKNLSGVGESFVSWPGGEDHGFANDPNRASVNTQAAFGGRNIDIHINGSGGVPVVPASPSIIYNYEVVFNVQPNGHGTIDVGREHTQFPWHELLIECLDCGGSRVISGTGALWRFSPKQGATPWNLYDTEMILLGEHINI